RDLDGAARDLRGQRAARAVALGRRQQHIAFAQRARARLDVEPPGEVEVLRRRALGTGAAAGGRQRMRTDDAGAEIGREQPVGVLAQEGDRVADLVVGAGRAHRSGFFASQARASAAVLKRWPVIANRASLTLFFQTAHAFQRASQYSCGGLLGSATLAGAGS